ncbi:MAG: outer membrane protein assembly factor BamB [Castellaniella sp.]|uniref:outer membrane protein assembly factor BamB n=1 Tax=Castellaniella sp. TaxID=1955812 RepID=UPI001226C417|nr:outer membrane protein assembly factor BamB [Castellaniella sp.]TAN26631.1 MAG: outer membrane protein assembly factor BamB [Castellaniella sp.]
MRSTTRLLRAAVLCLTAVSLAGCGLFTQKDARFDPAPLTEYAPSLAVAARWTASIGSGGGYGFAPQVVGDTVYAAAPSGSVVALDLASGAVRWQVATKPLSAGVGSDGHVTAVVTQEGMVVAYDAQGKQLWASQAASAVNVPPAVGNGIVAVRTTDYRVQAFDAASGKLRWNVQRPGPALALRTSMQMAVEPHLLVVGMPSGRLMVLDAASGAVRWEGTISASRGASDLERISDVVGKPQIIGPMLCGVSYQGHTTCFDVSQGGRAVWSQDISSATGLTNDGQHLYLADQRDVVRALDLKDGHPLWQQSALLNRRLSTPAVVGPALAVGDYQGYVHFLSRTDGKLMARLQVGSGPIQSALVASPQGVLVQTGDGKLLLVGVRG